MLLHFVINCYALCKPLLYFQLTVDHTVDNVEELERLQALGLEREQLKKAGRLGGQENTRCIGDYGIKEGYTEVDSIRYKIQ